MKRNTEEKPIIPRTYLDWSFDDDESQNYKFMVNRNEHQLQQGDRVKLTVFVRPDYQFGNIIKVEDDCIFIHTDEWLDISEEYSISLA